MPTLYVRWVGQRAVGRKKRQENVFVVVGREGYGEIGEGALRRAYGQDVVDLSNVVQFAPLPQPPATRGTTKALGARFWREFNDGLWERAKKDVPDTL